MTQIKLLNNALILAGDPLYVSDGKPQSSATVTADGTFAEDG